MFFKNGASGWTESVYNGSATLGPVQTAAPILLDQRLALMPSNNVCTAVKISDITVFRSAQYQTIPGLPKAGTYPLITGEKQLPPRVACGIRLGTASGNNRVWLLHGLPSSVVLNDALDPASAWNGAALTFCNYLKFAGNGWALSSPIIFGPRFNDCTDIDVNGNITTVLATPVGPVAGDLIGIHRIRGLDPEPNRAFRLVSINAMSPFVSIAGWAPRLAYAKPFTITYKRLNVAQITTAVLDVLTTRKTGRVPFLLRGRRSPDR